jgi:hypothetical protein
MTCDQCSEPAMAIAPGSEPVIDLFLLKRGAKMRCWCRHHWMTAFGEEHNEPVEQRDNPQ